MRPEGSAQRFRFGLVVQCCPRTVCIYVVDVALISLGVAEGSLHGPSGTVCSSTREVGGVCAHPKSEHFGIDPNAALERTFASFEHHHGGAFAEYGARTRFRERTASVGAEHAQSLPTLERPHRKTRLGTPGNRHRDLTAAQHLERLPDRMRS